MTHCIINKNIIIIYVQKMGNKNSLPIQVFETVPILGLIIALTHCLRGDKS